MIALDPALLATAQLVLFGVFGGALLHKLRDRRRFVGVLRDYRVVPAALVSLAAMVAIAFEVFVVTGVAFDATRGPAGFVGAALLTLYSAAIGINLARGRSEIDCGCSWGAAGQPISGALIGRNALLVLVASSLLAEPTGRALALGDGLAATAAAVGLLVCYRTFETLLAQAPLARRLQSPDR